MLNFVNIIVFLNLIIFGLWIISDQMGFFFFMKNNFLVSWMALSEGRWWVLLTSAFSHLMFFHFFINMYALRSFGPIISRTIGRMRFVRFYLVASIFSGLTHALVSNFLIEMPGQEALGASGAVAGIILLFSLIYPEEKLLIFGLVPIRAIWGAVIFIGLDLWGLMAQTKGGGLPIGHGAHLGGAFIGIIYYFKLKLQTRHRADKFF